ncbi:DEAD/DEAH box helicase [Allostella sp. ATCC 35155]|nr:DEAD/DEAH box helicase [Stella sp. ATCC 35155]
MSAPLAQALAARDYAEPTPVQAAVLEAEAHERDLLVSAQTGSGKTVAYGLAFASTLLGDAERLPRAGQPLALVVAPTRELALQVHRELTWLYAQTGAVVAACVGGMDPGAERRRLQAGAHIVVGTPGRLRDHLERGVLVFDALAAVVLDEADEMLDLGFREDLEFLLDATPPERRTLLFSATLPPDIVKLAVRYQRNAHRIAVVGAERGHADIEYRCVRVHPRAIELAVVNVLRFIEAPSAIVFCNTREAVRHLLAILLERGFAAVALSGELSQNERNHALQALRDGRARVCVATDVAARGIDLPNLGLVVHAELPHDPEVLQHRSGRTGRAGRKGVSILMVPANRRRRAELLLSAARVGASWSGPPTADDIRGLDRERMLADPLLSEPVGEEDLALAQALLADRSPEAVAAALVRVWRSQRPAPEEVYDPGVDRGPRERTVTAAPDRAYDRAQDRAPGGGKPRLAGRGVWFRLNVGRQKNADPRWLLPMICRQGMITKAEIGAIRIFDRETRFEVAEQAVDGFMTAIRRLERGEVRIEQMPLDGHRHDVHRPDGHSRDGHIEGAVRRTPPRQNRTDQRPPRTGRAA